MTERRREQLARLAKIQNRPEHECHDIMTITGFMTDEEVEHHVLINSTAVERQARADAANALTA